VSLQRFARTKGGRVIFCHVDPTVHEVFRVSKLEPLFAFAPDRAAALALVEAPAAANGTTPAPAAIPPSTNRTGGALRGRTGKKLS